MSIDPVRTSFFIDGGWREPSNASTFPVISPLTEEEIGSVPAAGTADVDAAVDAARTAFRRSGGAISNRRSGRSICDGSPTNSRRAPRTGPPP